MNARYYDPHAITNKGGFMTKDFTDMLGRTYVDKITNFRGVCVAVCTYITRCSQVLLVPPASKEGAYVDGQWIDVTRVEDMNETAITLFSDTAPAEQTKTPGFDKPGLKI